MKGRIGERGEKNSIISPDTHTLGLCSGVCLPLLSLQHCGVWPFFMLQLVQGCPWVPSSWTEEVTGRCKVAALGGDRCQRGELVPAGQVVGEGLPMDGPPLLLLSECNPLSLSSQTPLASLGSCLLPAVLVCFSLLGKCPLRESDSQITAAYSSKDTKQEKRLKA